MKKIYLILVCVILVSVNMSFAQSEQEPIYTKGAALISETTANQYGEATCLGISPDDSVKLFDDNTIAYEDNSYEYYIAGNGKYIKAMLAKDENTAPMFSGIGSSQEAEEYALQLIADAYPELFNSQWDIFVQSTNFDSVTRYTVDIWEKIGEGAYTGQKFSVCLTSDGRVELLLSLDNGGSTVLPPQISKDDAIAIAYTECKIRATELETPVDANGNIIADDSEDPYHIFIEDTDSHVVDSYTDNLKGVNVWVVNISNVKTNRPWGPVTFFVVLDSSTGEIIRVSNTR